MKPLARMVAKMKLNALAEGAASSARKSRALKVGERLEPTESIEEQHGKRSLQ